MKINNRQRFVIAHDIFSRDVFFDITVEFQLKIPIKKKEEEYSRNTILSVSSLFLMEMFW